jgi:hypothetical protein
LRSGPEQVDATGSNSVPLAVKQREQHPHGAILFLARERTEILHLLVEQRAHGGSIAWDASRAEHHLRGRIQTILGKPKRNAATSEDGPGKSAFLRFSYELNNGLATEENVHESHSISARRAVGSGRYRGPRQRLRREELLPAAGTYTKLIGQTRSAAAFAAALYANGKQPEDFTCARA